MAKYTKEDMIEQIENCKKLGIQDQGRLYQIQSGMRAGVELSVIEAVSKPELSEIQIQRILGLAVNGYPEEEIQKLCCDPEKIADNIEAYYKNLYGTDRRKVYQEIFDGFQIQWQKNYDQLLMQTDTLSNMLQFLRVQLELKEREVQEVREQIVALQNQLNDGQEQLQVLKAEKAVWSEQQEREKKEVQEAYRIIPEEEENEDEYEDSESMPENGSAESIRVVKQGFMEKIFRKRTKNDDPEKELITLIERLDDEQIEEVLQGYEQGLSMEEIKRYAKPGLSLRQMREIKKLLLRSKGESK